MLVGLRAGDGDQQAAARYGLDVAEAEPDEFGAAQRGTEAEQQHGAAAGTEWTVR